VDDLEGPMNALVLPHWVVAAVACVPGGAWPSYAHGHYARDNAFYRNWDDVSRDRAAFTRWMGEHVTGTLDHRDFLRSLRGTEDRAPKGERVP
jgi:glutaconate CoA-transferase, subunit A